MLIDREGNIIMFWERKNGPVIIDKNNAYGIEFTICLPYENDRMGGIFQEIKKLKKQLEGTDYKLMKFMDGDITKEEYAPIQAEREAWRQQIRNLEAQLIEPSLTKEEIEAAEKAAMEKLQDES